MPIYYHCKTCKTSFALGLDKCPRCNAEVPREGRRFRVVVISKGRTVARIVKGSIDSARDLEKKIGGQLVDNQYKSPAENRREAERLREEDEKRKREAIPIPTLDEVWAKYFTQYQAIGKASVKEES